MRIDDERKSDISTKKSDIEIEGGQDHLVDERGGQTAYRVEELIGAGERRQVAAARDVEQGRDVAVRAVVYDEESPEAVERRRGDLRREWEFLEAAADTGFSPRPVEWLEVRDSPIDEPPEPVVICERIDGPDLHEWITGEHPQGVDPEIALEWMDELADFLAAIHGEKWLWRDFDPRRFAVEEGSRLRARSIGAVVRRGDRLHVDQLDVNRNYVAPEIREEMSGKLQRPAADLYGAGALLSFLLTGEEPRHRVESPLSYSAYERIQQLELPGLELLIARLFQPLAKKRIGRADRLRPFCSVENLPSRETDGFGICTLPAPWLGLDIDDPETNRGLRSNLSSGPLVSMPRSSGDKTPAEQGAVEADASSLSSKVNWPVVVGLMLLVVAAIVFAVLSG